MEIVFALAMGLIVWWTAKEALGTGINQTGKVTSFILYLNLIFRPLRVIADKFNVLQMGIIASERVFKVLDNNDYINQAWKLCSNRSKREMNFENVWFGYNPEAFPVLKNINFHVQPGANSCYCWSYR